MDRARRKEKQRLKRKEKQRQSRKSQSITALRKITSTGGTLECWINRDYRDQGMASVLVLGHAGGQYAFAGFLVDVWCVGLKDTWGKPDITRSEFEDEIFQRINSATPMKRIDADALRGFIAGSIRFARQNGFRLPPQYERWTAMLGSLSIDTADLAEFGKDGKLIYMGTRQFLVQRLSGMTIEQFLTRPDVQWVTPTVDLPFNQEAFDRWQENQDDADKVDPQTVKSVLMGWQRGTDAVREWCKEHGVTPHPRIPEAISMMMAVMGRYQELQEEDPDGEPNIDDILEDLLVVRKPQDMRTFVEALSQVVQTLDDAPDGFIESAFGWQRAEDDAPVA